MSKKKKIKVGTISGLDLLKSTRGIQNIPCRTGAHMTEKDRPRKKFKPKDIRKEDF